MPKKFSHQKVSPLSNPGNNLLAKRGGAIPETHRSILKKDPDIIRKLLID
jgi:hypothetical protein